MLPTLLRRRPSWQDPFDAMRREMESMFGQAMTPWSDNEGEIEETTAAYPVDIHEEDDTIHVDAELPGFKKDQVHVTLNQGVLRIVAQRTDEDKAKKKKGHRHLHERRYTRIERCFTLPTPVMESKVDARLDDGVLHLTLRKTKETQPSKIAIK